MDKYLVFALERRTRVNVSETPVSEEGFIQAVYVEPRYEDKKFPCFELVGEFEIPKEDWSGSTRFTAEGWAYGYSLDNKVRTLVVKGTIFEG